MNHGLYKYTKDRSKEIAIIWMVVGNIIYAVSINTLITPVGLYNGGFLGIAQLLRVFIVKMHGISFPVGFDITGIIYFIMNVPLFFYAYKTMGKRFTIKTLASIGLSSLCLTFVPIPKAPLLEDHLSACIVGGVVGGIGSGLILRGGSSTGGSDVIGVCMAKKNPNFSVGAFNIIVNACVYLICFFVFNFQVAIYSFIYTAIRSVYMDKMHTQNINTETVIFTKVEGLEKKITAELGRGVTCWDGVGAYTGEKVHIMLVAITKYEIPHLKHLVLENDPKAFMIVNEGDYITGNFKKHFD